MHMCCGLWVVLECIDSVVAQITQLKSLDLQLDNSSYVYSLCWQVKDHNFTTDATQSTSIVALKK